MGRGSVNGIGQGLDGDLTTTEARCITSLPQAAQGRRGVLRLGDVTTPCPKCGKPGEIVESLPAMKWDGKPTVLDGALIKCGCPLGTHRLIAPLEPFRPDSDYSRPPAAFDGAGAGAFKQADKAAPEKTFARAFAITDSDGQPLINRKFVARVDGRETTGVTDTRGIAHVQAPSADSTISLHIVFSAPARTLNELSENGQ